MKVNISNVTSFMATLLLYACIDVVFADGQAGADEFAGRKIAYVFIKSAAVLQGDSDGINSCGIRYQARIREAYGIEKDYSRNVSFITGRPLKVGADYLIFLSARNHDANEIDKCGLNRDEQQLGFPYALEFVDTSLGQPSDESSLYLLYDPMRLDIPDGVRAIGKAFRKCKSADALTGDPDAATCPLVQLVPVIEWISLKQHLTRRKELESGHP